MRFSCKVKTAQDQMISMADGEKNITQPLYPKLRDHVVPCAEFDTISRKDFVLEGQ